MRNEPPPMTDTLRRNLQRLSTVAQQGYAQAGRGVVAVEYAGGAPSAIHYLPEAHVYTHLVEAPVLLELAVDGLERYDPQRQAAVLAYSVEGDEPVCWVIDLEYDEAAE